MRTSFVIAAPLAAALVTSLLAPPTPARAQHEAHKEQLGTVRFENSCRPDVQERLQQAVAMLHSFRYQEGERAFRDVLARDTTCAVATWGIAALLMSNPIAGVGSPPQWAARAQAAIAEGRRIGARTQRERDYIEAVAAYYEDWAGRPERARQAARARAFAELAARYPADDEAQIFAALYQAATQSLADQSYARSLAAAEVLDRQLVRHPDHPGLAHYLIHVFDAPPIAAKGLPAARRYASIAPSAPHALHMPSHIFTRVGAWTESAATNERSAAAARRDGDYDEQLHAADYMVYAYLQLARDDDARRAMETAAGVTGVSASRIAGPYARAAIPARWTIERADYRQAARLEPRASEFLPALGLTHLARALGAARSGDPAAAPRDVEALARLRDTLRAAGNEYWANEMEVGRLGAAAWTALARGEREEALRLMRAAADMEDRTEKHIVTPGRLAPARELLGEMLLELGRPAEALREFEASHVREPDRFRGLAGAARAAVRGGDRAKARRYYERLVEVASHGTARPELTEARAFLAAGR